MDGYEIWRVAVLEAQPDLPESYARALYDHWINPGNQVLSDIWWDEWLKMRELEKRKTKNANTIGELIECGLLNLKDRLNHIFTEQVNTKKDF